MRWVSLYCKAVIIWTVLFWIIVLGGAAFVLSGCVGNAPPATSNACSNPVSAIIHPSRQDTIETLRQVDTHNKAARDLCPDGR